MELLPGRSADAAVRALTGYDRALSVEQLADHVRTERPTMKRAGRDVGVVAVEGEFHLVADGSPSSRHAGEDWGRIVFVASESAVQIPVEMIHYGVTKTA